MIKLTVLRVMRGVRLVALCDLDAGVGRLREDEALIEEGPAKERGRAKTHLAYSIRNLSSHEPSTARDIDSLLLFLFVFSLATALG